MELLGAKECSHSGARGGAGESGLRTSFGIKLVLGLPSAQHNLAPLVASPFQFTLKSAGQAHGGGDMLSGERPALRHPICRVFGWQRRLEQEKELTKVQIGQQEGLSKARVAQMFALLHLPKEAQEYLGALTDPELIRAFSVRQLRGVPKCLSHSGGKPSRSCGPIVSVRYMALEQSLFTGRTSPRDGMCLDPAGDLHDLIHLCRGGP